MICLSIEDGHQLRNFSVDGQGVLQMRWEKEKQFVEIKGAISVEFGEVWHVQSERELCELPVGFRCQIPKTDEIGYLKLKQAVAGWAERHGYDLVPG